MHKLSDDRLDDLFEIYSNSDESTHQYFNYLKCNLNLIREINKRKKNLIELNDELKNKIDELDFKITSLHKQFSDSEKANDNLQIQLNDSKELNNKQQNKTENLVKQLQDHLINMILVKGQISTKVEKGLVISAEINLTENGSQLDSSKSKFIICSNCLEVKLMKKENQSYHFK